MGPLNGFTFKKGLKEMFSQIRRSVERIPRVRKKKSGLGPFRMGIIIEINASFCYFITEIQDRNSVNIFSLLRPSQPNIEKLKLQKRLKK